MWSTQHYSVLNSTCEQIFEKHDLFNATFLVGPRFHTFSQASLASSQHAVLRCGELYAGGVLYFSDHSVGKVVTFWAETNEPGAIWIEFERYSPITGDANARLMLDPHVKFAFHDTVIDNLIWYEAEPGVLRFAVPPAVLFTRDTCSSGGCSSDRHSSSGCLRAQLGFIHTVYHSNVRISACFVCLAKVSLPPDDMWYRNSRRNRNITHIALAKNCQTVKFKHDNRKSQANISISRLLLEVTKTERKEARQTPKSN